MRILITAGPTREYLDDVRYLSNASSGRMGFAVAAAAVAAAAAIVVVVIASALGWIENTTSPCSMPNLRPRPEVPAWNSTGRPCALGSTGPTVSQLKNSPW